MTADRRRVIFDTDPGIDDAMALLFLHAAPEVDLVGVTTCFGNGTLADTTRNARHIVERFAIPTVVIAGADGPLEGAADLPPAHVHGGNALGDVDVEPVGAHDTIPAWRFIIDKIREDPGEISVVAVGRMTNLALALRADPEIASLVRDVVIMGGAFGHHGHHGNVTPLAEANIHGDARAADEVFAAAWPITVVGLDVTMQTRMSEDVLAGLRRDVPEAGGFIWDITRVYTRFHQASTCTIPRRLPACCDLPCSRRTKARSASCPAGSHTGRPRSSRTVAASRRRHGMAARATRSARTSTARHSAPCMGRRSAVFPNGDCCFHVASSELLR